MNKYFNYITDKLIAPNQVSARIYRSAIGKWQGWVSVLVNGILFVIKLIIGIAVGSVSIIADAIHTLSDVISSGIVIWGFHEAEKPADPEHPYGHGRIEHIATLIIAVLLIVAGIEFIRTSVGRIINPAPISPSWTMVIIIFVTIFLKEIIARYAQFLSQKISSGTLKADAWHHRADAISSLLVVIAMIAGKYGYYSIDGWAGLGVALFVIWTGSVIAKEAIDEIIGTPPSDAMIEDVKQIVSIVEGVLGVHDITIHSYGAEHFASIHIEIDENKSSAQAHDISEEIEQTLYHKLGIEPTIHIDPISVNNPMIKKVKRFLEQNWSVNNQIKSWHDIRIVDTEKHHVILFGINTGAGMTKSENVQICQKLSDSVKKEFQGFEVDVKASPLHKF